MQKRAVSKSIRAYSITEIFLLVTMTFAVAFMLGQQVKLVSAAGVQTVSSGYINLFDGSSVNILKITTDNQYAQTIDGHVYVLAPSGNYYILTPYSNIPSSYTAATSTPAVASSALTATQTQDAAITNAGPDNALPDSGTAASRVGGTGGTTTIFTPGTTNFVLSDVNAVVKNPSIGQNTPIIGYSQITDASGTKYIFSTTGLKNADGTVTKEFTLTKEELFDTHNIPEAERTKLLGAFEKITPQASTSLNGLGATGNLFGLGVGPGASSNFFLANLYTGITHAVIVAGIVGMIASLFGANSQTTAALTKSVGAGILGARIVNGLFGKGVSTAVGKQGILTQSLSGAWVTGIGVAIAIAVFVLTYKKEKQELVNFQCLPFEPALGGSKCEECNKDPYRPCSEYRCKSLGQACELLNQGTDHEACTWVSPKDVTSPTITPWNAALRPTGLTYQPDNAIRPGARGVKIVSTASGGCLAAFTPLQFGVTTNEPAQCKIDYNLTTSFDAMRYYFGGSNYYEYNHTQQMRLPSPNSTDSDLSPLLQNDGSFSLFVRCQDANGNVNVDAYSISFCVSKAPDTTPPVIEGTSITDGSPVQANADSTPIEVYTNEPADCKWSRQDRSFDDMENSMSCASAASQVNANLQYTCSGSLTGVTNMINNTYYFRCKDQPGAADNVRNVMSQSYMLTLRGTQKLDIVSAGPNGTIAASTSVVPVDLTVETDDGADTGKAVCYFSPTGNKDSYIEMFNTNAVFHKQPLSLTAGDYTYYFRCVDAGGNAAEAQTSFTVKVDNSPPTITRVYKETDALKIVTDENAQCVYSLTSCNYQFTDGLKFDYLSPDSQTEHVTKWKINMPYYIKCRDQYGNEPSPNSCSIIAAGLDLSIQAKTSS